MRGRGAKLAGVPQLRQEWLQVALGFGQEFSRLTHCVFVRAIDAGVDIVVTGLTVINLPFAFSNRALMSSGEALSKRQSFAEHIPEERGGKCRELFKLDRAIDL